MTKHHAQTCGAGEKRPVGPKRSRAASGGIPAGCGAMLAAAGACYWKLDAAARARFLSSAAGSSRIPVPALRRGECLAPHEHARMLAFVQGLPRAKLPAALEFTTSGRGAGRSLRLTVLRRAGRAGQLVVSGVTTDISAQKRLQSDLLQVTERVQNRIGQELHDDLCQVLAGLSCLTRVLENRIAPQLPAEVENLREINHQLVEAMDRTRALTHGLYPARMRSGDVRAALLELAKEVRVRFGIAIQPRFQGRFPAHSEQEILQVYRIAQEAISNAIRHGRAAHITLRLVSRGETMQLQVQDDGVGFPNHEEPHPGIGLQIMQHRAAQIGGTVQTRNAPRRGALVVLHYHPGPRT